MLTKTQKDRKVEAARKALATTTDRLTRAKARVTELEVERAAAARTLDWLEKAPVVGEDAPAAAETPGEQPGA